MWFSSTYRILILITSTGFLFLDTTFGQTKFDLKKQTWYSNYVRDTSDQNGFIYIAGKYDSPTLKIGEIELINPNKTGSGTSVFVTKLDSTGKVIWAQTAGGDSYDDVNDIRFTNEGDLIITGDFRSSVFHMIGDQNSKSHNEVRVRFKNRNKTSSSDGDMYVAKFNSLGVLVWANAAGGQSSDIGWTVVVDEKNQVIIEGTSISDTIFFDDKILIKNGRNYESINFKAVYSSEGKLINLIEKDAGYKMLVKDFENYFNKCLSEFKIKITCAGCTAVYYDFKISIDKNGEFLFGATTREKFCNDKLKEKFEKKLNDFLKTYKYADELKGKTIELNVNRVLKC